MQRLGMIQAYGRLVEGEDAVFVHPQGNLDNARLVKFRLISESDVQLYLVPVDYDYAEGNITAHYDDPERTMFLTALKPGFDEVEFHYRGSFCLRVRGGSVLLDTYDNTALDIESADPTSFARLWEREERDPRILEIEQIARHNRMALEQQMMKDRAEFAAMMEELKAKNVSTSGGASELASQSGEAEGSGVSSAGDNDESGTPAGGNGGE